MPLRSSVSISNLSRKFSSARLKPQQSLLSIQPGYINYNNTHTILHQFIILFHQNIIETEVRKVILLIEQSGSVTKRYGLMPYDLLVMMDSNQAKLVLAQACVAKVQRC